MKNLILFALLLVESPMVDSKEVKEYTWEYGTKLPSDFEEPEQYIFYKIQQCRRMAGIEEEMKNPNDLLRHFYFTGKAKAYEDILSLHDESDDDTRECR